MNQSDVPARFPIPFANGAGGAYIRPIPKDHVAASGTDAPASLTDGFPPETFTPIASGGVPPNGKDFNGILNQITAGMRWFMAGGAALFDSTFCTAIGGYPKGAQLSSLTTPGTVWVSTVDANATDPDGVGAANWVAIKPTAGVLRVTDHLFSTDGYIAVNDGTWASDFLVEWKRVNCSAGGSTAFSWPKPFPNNLFGAAPGGFSGLGYSGSYSPYLAPGVSLTGGSVFGNNGGGSNSVVTIWAWGN